MGNTKIILSIIVPIYNVEGYLRKCVDSLLNQDIDSYEIILVDDGSPDRCPQICDEYATLYTIHHTPSIRVIHQKNAGLSAARNSGVEVAKGEFVMFVDSDDYIELNVLGTLVKRIEDDKLDVLRYDYQNVRKVESGESRVESAYEVFQPYKTPHHVDGCHEIVDGVTYLNTRMSYECYAWQWIIRKSIVSTFTPSIHFEDVDWLPRMMLRAKRVGSTQTVVYNYFWREGSITLTQGNKEKIRKNLDDRMGIIEKYSELRKMNPTCTWLRNMQSSMVTGVLTTVAREFYKERKEYIKRLRGWNVFPIAFADHGKTHARRARVINMFGANAYCVIMRLCALCKV